LLTLPKSTSNETEVNVPLMRTDPHAAFAVAPYEVDPVKIELQLKSGFLTVGSMRVPPTMLVFSPPRSVNVTPEVVTSSSDQVTVR
jgi:hypothetical protein